MTAAEAPRFGAIWFKRRLDTDRGTRTAVFATIEGQRYERVLNTPCLIVRASKYLCLCIGSNTRHESAAVTGPRAREKRVPDAVARLVEPVEDHSAETDDFRIIATEPTELVVSTVDPSWSPVARADFLYMDNIDSNVFLELSTQCY
jgi:hypothetical protein